MRAQRPAGPEALRRRTLDANSRALDFDVRLVTFQFGGGVQPRVALPNEWLRGSSLRGALRFWWRATTQVAEADLLAAEDAIFGSAAASKRAGPSSLAVHATTTLASGVEAYVPSGGAASPVAFFPAQANNRAPAAELLAPGATAHVSIRAVLDEVRWREVERAVSAWLLFGGVGARTRRAAGRVELLGGADSLALPQDRAGLSTWLTNVRAGHLAPSKAFTLSRLEAAHLGPPVKTADEAHKSVLETWRAIRQDRPHPQSWDGREGWGRSTWPEADAIRIATGQHAVWARGVQHEPDGANRDRAPRAHLGLPIILKFKDTTQSPSRADRGTITKFDPGPGSYEIRATQASDRYASPVVLSVVKLGARWAPIALIAPSALRGAVQLKGPAVAEGTTLNPGTWREVRDRVVVRLTERQFTPLFDMVQ